MPEGLPGADKLMENYNVFFSIDTNIIQALGYKFDSGALSKLPLQRPNWMLLYMAEVVQKEIKSHRMDAVEEDANRFSAALERMQKSSGFDFSSLKKSYEKEDVKIFSDAIFDKQLDDFIHSLGGKILKTDGADLAKDMFNLYFNNLPPFEVRKDKKNEFPDAAALLVLEGFAKQEKICGVLISGDAGWANFANTSEHLYCVKSLEEFTSLFASDGKKAEEIKHKITSSLSDRESSFSSDLLKELSDYVSQADWVVDEIYGNGPGQLAAEVVDAILLKDKVEFLGFKVWLVEHDPSMCVVEISLSALVGLNLSVLSYAGGSILKDLSFTSSFEYSMDVNFETNIFATFYGDILNDEFSLWEYDLVWGGGSYSVDVGYIDDKFSRQDM